MAGTDGRTLPPRTPIAVLALATLVAVTALTGSTLAEPAGRAVCVDDLEAIAREDAAVQLTWNASGEAGTYRVFRAAGDGEFEPVAEVRDAAYVDERIAADVTYRYRVTAGDAAGGKGCPVVAATAIPFATGAAALAATVPAAATVATLARVDR